MVPGSLRPLVDPELLRVALHAVAECLHDLPDVLELEELAVDGATPVLGGIEALGKVDEPNNSDEGDFRIIGIKIGKPFTT